MPIARQAVPQYASDGFALKFFNNCGTKQVTADSSSTSVRAEKPQGLRKPIQSFFRFLKLFDRSLRIEFTERVRVRICMVSDPMALYASAARYRPFLRQTDPLADHEEGRSDFMGRQAIEHLGCDHCVRTVVKRQCHFSSGSVTHASGRQPSL